MGKKKNNKKNSITFRLVSRSQQDPLINYDDAPQSVLVEETKSKDRKDRKAEQRKYGIYYDDDYDYLQHLKGVEEVDEEYYFEEFDPKGTRVKEIKTKDEIEQEKGIIKLPSSVFPSQYQESVGMLNKGVLPKGPRIDWDQDIVEAMCDDFDLEDENNVLDDDFIIQAMGGDIKPTVDDEYDDEEFNKFNDDYKKKVKWEKDEFNNDGLSNESYDEEEDDRHTIRTVGGKTEFTNYSLTSSVIRRNEKLNDLDEHFEEFFLKQIAEEAEQESDSDQENEHENAILKNLINEHNENKDRADFHEDLPKEAIIKIAERQQEDEENNVEDLEEVELRLATGKNEYEDRWDCETILTNYTNIYNRPKLILEPKSNKIKLNKLGIPEQDNKLTEKGLKKFNKEQEDEESVKTMVSLISQLSVRNKNESKEEKQLRKKNLKEYMKDRRQEKKANRLAFKEENIRIQNEKVHNRQMTAMKF